jgi:hypothetical protein
MLFRETVTVYCENHMEHTDTLCGQNTGFWYVKEGGIYSIIFLLLVGWTKPLGTAATSGLLYKPQMIDEDGCGAIGGMKIGRETEVLGENLPQRHFVHQLYIVTTRF